MSASQSTAALPSKAMLDMWYGRVGRAKPFLRWAGGKQAFLFRFADRLPTFSGTYFEPFLGSGAVFFHLTRRAAQPFQVRLGDTNKQLIRTFIAVRDEPETLHEDLVRLQHAYSASSSKSEFFYELRDRYNSSGRANPADFIVLNRTCWNGLYRTNREGKFNVPFGAPKTDNVIPSSLDDLLNASAALRQADLRATSWQYTVARAQLGDFIFFDPPYYSDVLREDSKYGRRAFGLREHERLATYLQQLTRRGVGFVLTNSGEPEMVELYRSYGLAVEAVELPRPINSKIERRIPVPEIIVTPQVDQAEEGVLLPLELA